MGLIGAFETASVAVPPAEQPSRPGQWAGWMEWVDYSFAYKMADAFARDGSVALVLGGSPQPFDEAVGASFLFAVLPVEEAEKLRDQLTAAIAQAKQPDHSEAA